MSGILKLCVQLFGTCCGSRKESKKRREAINKTTSESDVFESSSGYKRMRKNWLGTVSKARVMERRDTFSILGASLKTNILMVEEEMDIEEERCLSQSDLGPTMPSPTTKTTSPSHNLENRSVKSEGELVVNSAQAQLFDGMSAILAAAVKSLSLLICPRHIRSVFSEIRAM